MKTTNKQFKEQIQKHILESLSTDTFSDEKNQLRDVIIEFIGWYSPYERKRTPNHQQAFVEFLQCLPSCLSVEFEYYKINETLKSWYENCEMEYINTGRESEFYYNLIYREFKTLCKKHNLSVF